MKLVFNADKITVSNRKADGSIRVSFDTGEYEVDNLTAIFPLQFEEKAWKITIEEAE